MNPFPTNSRKFNFADNEEVGSKDLNALSAYLCQLFKDSNLNIFQGQSPNTTLPGCIINGCQVTLTPGNPVTVSVGAGLILFALSTDDPKNYSGYLFEIQNPTTPIGVAAPIASGPITYFIDIRYQEFVGEQQDRYVYSEVTQLASLQAVPVELLQNQANYIMLTNAASPNTGYTRMAQFTVNPNGTVSEVTYTLPLIWNLQQWPNIIHASNLNETKTLSDSLSAIRAEIAAILGPNKNWYSEPAITLDSANTSIASLVSSMGLLQAGIKKAVYLPAGTTGFHTVPSGLGITRAWIKLWGPGGSGAASYTGGGGWQYSGGGGGAGCYIEAIFPVTEGWNLSYLVGAQGTGTPTRIETIPLDSQSLLWARAGGNGTGPSDFSGGAGGTMDTAVISHFTGTYFTIPGQPGRVGGYLHNVYPNDIIGKYSRYGICVANGGFSFGPLGFFGHGGYSGPIGGNPGTPGAHGAILIYYM